MSETKYDNEGNIIYKFNYVKGEGKKYYFNKLTYEGEFLNGNKNGKGKEYFTDGKLKFQGEYLNDKK